jgi:hypothetical protein
MRTVEAKYLLNTTDVIGDRNLVTLSATASPLPTITLLSLTGPLDYRNGSFAKRTAQNQNHYRVHQWTREWLYETDIEATNQNFHFAEPVGRDRWLLVCARAADDQEHNAFICSSAGERINSFPAGDGIEDVQVTHDGSEVWISYFDEGVFSGGNFGVEGLMGFESDGTPAFRYVTDAAGREPYNVPYITDCYALNVTSNGNVWLYYYTDFPLVRLHNGQVKAVWNNLPFSGSHAFAVTDDRVLFGGGYNETDRLHLMPLYNNAEGSETIMPVDTNGDPIAVTHRLFARGNRLYLLRNNDLFVLDLNIHL